jgi:hypothetical protein
MKYNCSKCAKELSSKQNLKKHELKCNLNFKIPIDNLQCEFCSKLFASSQSKSNHKKKVCQKKKEWEIHGNQNITQIGDHNTANSHNIHLENSPITIVFNFGDEKEDKLSREFLDEVIREKDLNGIFQLIKNRYFNKPENNTIRKVNKKDTLMDVKKDGEWIKTPCNHIINQILNKVTEEPNFHLLNRLEFRESEINAAESHKKEWKKEQRDKFIQEVENYLQKAQVLGYFYERDYYLDAEQAPNSYEKQDYTQLLEHYNIPLEIGKNKSSYKKQIREYLYVETKKFLEKLKNT